MSSELIMELRVYFNDLSFINKELLKKDKYGNSYIPLKDLIDKAKDLVNYYKSLNDFSCCSMQVGLEIIVNGYDFTGGYSDHFWHLGGWFLGLKYILQKGSYGECDTFVWDESFLKWRREGNRLTLSDENNNWLPVMIDFNMFASKLLEELEYLNQFRINMIKNIEEYGYSIDIIKNRIKDYNDKPRPKDDDLELKLAVILNEIEALDFSKDIDEIKEILNEENCHEQIY